MADTKISALTGATTPLAGTEVVPLVQSSTTKNVSVANLTAGRAVSASTLSLSSSAGSNNLVVERATVGGFAVTADTGGAVLSPTIVEGIQFYDKAVSVRAAKLWTDTGNLNLYTGNLVIGTSGKGIDFSANSHASGMTSELLSDYEEGTWTPTVTASDGSFTTVSASGTYTSIGRAVSFSLIITITDAGTASGSCIATLPFTAGQENVVVIGRETNATGYSLQGTILSGYAIVSIQKYDNTGMIATGNIFTISGTYFV